MAKFMHIYLEYSYSLNIPLVCCPSDVSCCGQELEGIVEVISFVDAAVNTVSMLNKTVKGIPITLSQMQSSGLTVTM